MATVWCMVDNRGNTIRSGGIMKEKDLQFDNLDTYNQDVGYYRNYELNPPERNALELFKNKWHTTRMLDIGVGGGRTTYTFAALVKNYVGIDYSPPMVEECKRTFKEREHVIFEVCDAADMTRYYDNKFDFILFSQNGIDSVDHPTRQKILSETRKCLKDDGYFFFSTHSINGFSLHRESMPFNKRNILKSLYTRYHDYKYYLRKKRIYRDYDLTQLKHKSWEILITGDHNFKMKVYHIKPEYQVEQLKQAGFAVEQVYDRHGKSIDPLNTDSIGMTYFLCKPV